MREINIPQDASIEEMDRLDRLIELENKKSTYENADDRADQTRSMAWFALGGMLAYPVMLLLAGWAGLTESKLLADIAPTYFVSVAGVVSVFFGAEAYKKVKS